MAVTRNLASLITNDIMVALVKDQTMICLNDLLLRNGLKQQRTFEEAVVSCFDASLIDENTCFACIAISDKQNKTRYCAASYLMHIFGTP